MIALAFFFVICCAAGFFFIKLYHWRQDVLHGPYIVSEIGAIAGSDRAILAAKTWDGK
jgi:hypothetical protein